MNDTLEPQLQQLLQQLQQLIRSTAQEAAEESTVQLHEQLVQLESQLDMLLQDQRTLQDRHTRASAELQELAANVSRLESLRGELAETRGELGTSQARVQSEVAKLQATLEQQVQQRQQRLLEFQHAQAVQFQTLEERLGELANLAREAMPRSAVEETIQALRDDLHQQLKQLAEEHHERWTTASVGLNSLARQVTESARQQAELSQQVQDLKKLLESSIRDHQARQAETAKQLKEAREHITILNEQILSQARVLSDAELLRQKLQARLQSLEAQLAQESLKPRGLLGWLTGR